MWILFLLAVFFVGYLISKSFFKFLGGLPLLATSFGIGSILSVWFVYLASIVGGITTGVISYFLVVLFLAFSKREKLSKSVLRKIVTKETAPLIVLFVFSFSLFQRSFNYDYNSSQFLISSNLYQDMGAHIPFIRSFSLGNNFPAEVPFFAGEGLSYHFMFDLYAGILEFMGLPLVISLNLISSLSLTFLLLMIYEISVGLFKSKFVGFLSSLFFLLNGDLSFLEFFKKSDLNHEFLFRVWHNTEYYSLNILNLPYSNFLNLNVLLNQRQLIFGLLAFFIIIWILFHIDLRKDKRELLILSFLIGLLPFWHASIFVSAAIFLLILCLALFENTKSFIYTVPLLLVSFPQILLIKLNSANSIILRPGFLVWNNLSIQSFVAFWIFMFGAVLFFAIFAFTQATKKQRRFFLLFLPFFVIPNIFQVGGDMFDNHKFFNIFVICLNIFAAYGLYVIFRKNVVWKVVAACFFIPMMFSGFLSFLVAKNDVYVRISDYPKNSLLMWAKDNIPNSSIILTNGEIYDPISLLGKKVFLTREHYVFLYGGNPGPRMKERDIILAGVEIKEIDESLYKERVGYIIIYKQNVPNRFSVNVSALAKKYKKVYEDNYGIIIKI